MAPENTTPRFCNRCGAVADLGMTCFGPRCRNCGCDNADSDWGSLRSYIDDESRAEWEGA